MPARMFLGDTQNYVGISAPLPEGWPDADADIELADR
jgi:hypothetical protein